MNPEDYKNSDTYETITNIEDLLQNLHKIRKPKNELKLLNIVNSIINNKIYNQKQLNELLKNKRKELKITPKKTDLLYIYNSLIYSNKIKSNSDNIKLLQKKKNKK